MRSIEFEDKTRPGSCAPVNDEVVIEHTRRWISAFVIGLGLCPFARRVFDAGRIRYAISHSRDENTLSNDLAAASQPAPMFAGSRVTCELPEECYRVLVWGEERRPASAQ